MLDQSNLYPHEIVYAEERDTIDQCRRFSRRSGILIGGSTGSVLAATEQYIRRHDLSGQVVALISPDLGDSYLPTIYNDQWVREHFPEAHAPDELQPVWSEESQVNRPDHRRSANGARRQPLL
jgi:cysteine synthase A